MPPTVKVADIDVASLPRVTSETTQTALRAECKARGIKGYSSIDKSAALRILRPGSILLSGTEEFVRLETIKRIMQAEDHAWNENASQTGTHVDKSQQEVVPKRRKAPQEQRNQPYPKTLHQGFAVRPSIQSCHPAGSSTSKLDERLSSFGTISEPIMVSVLAHLSLPFQVQLACVSPAWHGALRHVDVPLTVSFDDELRSLFPSCRRLNFGRVLASVSTAFQKLRHVNFH